MPTAQLPDIKLVKVGKDRERKKKKGGIALFSSGTPGSFLAALGGEGGTGGFLQALHRILGPRLFLLLPKILVLGMMGSMGIGAYEVGHMLKRSAVHSAATPMGKAQVFVAKNDAGDAAVEAEAAKRGDSVGMIMQEARDGKTADERAAEAAAAAAAAKAAADADAKAKADAAAAAARQAQSAPPAGAAPPDAAAFAAAQTAHAAQMNAPLNGFKNGMNQGSAAGSSLTGWGFGQKMSIGGRLSTHGAPTGVPLAMSAPQVAQRTASPLGRVKGGGRGLGFNQLSRASQLSGSAVTSQVAETASQNAQNAFQPTVGGDSAIAGAPGATGTTASGTSSPGGTSGGANGANGTDPTIDDSGLGMCNSEFPSGGFVQSASGGCVCPPGQDSDGSSCSPVHSNNATPWQPMVDAAKDLTYAVAALLAIATAIALIANSMDLDFGTGEIVRQVAIGLCAIAAVLSAVVLFLGTSISGYGGEAKSQGTFFEVMGGIMTAAGAYAAYQYEQTDPLQWAKNVSIPGWSVDTMPIATAGLGAVAGGAAATQH